MRLATTFFLPLLLLVAAGLLSTASAALHRTRAKTLTKHGAPRIPAPQPIARRQYHPRRDLLDTCISLNASVISDVLEILKPLGLDFDLCLCLDNLDVFLDTDVRATVLSDLLGGKDKLDTALKVLINDKSLGKQCEFPPNSKQACVSGDPCAFTCDSPYVKVGDACACQAPLVECNGQCITGACSSAAPRLQKRTRSADEAPVTTLAEAQAHCKLHETVCGIAGSEYTNEFECIDTRVALDSCGGCVTPHPFPEPQVRAAATGVDCGRLPGVIGARCSQSKCAVSRCAGTWRPSNDRTKCVNDSVPHTLVVNPGPEVGTLRMRRERRRDEPLGAQASTNADVVLSSDLLSQLETLVDFVLKLRASVPASSGGSSSSSVDYVKLVDDIIEATANLLESPTVGSIDNLVRTSTLLKDLLGNCGCVDTLGLNSLLKYLDSVVDAALGIQQSGLSLLVTTPYPTVSSPAPSSKPKLNATGDTVIGLDDLLRSLGLSSVKSDVLVGGLGEELNGSLNGLLNGIGIGIGPSNVRARAAADASPDVDTNVDAVVDGNLLGLIKVLVKLVVKLKTSDSLLPAPADNGSSTSLPAPGSGPAPPIDRNLIDAIVQATADLLEAKNVASLINSLNVLINTNAVVTSTLGDCECVDDLGLGELVKDLDKVVDSTLGLKDWCADHPVVVAPIPSGPGTPSPSGGRPNILGIPIDLGLDNLLTLLGVDLSTVSDVDVDVDLQGLVNSLVQLVAGLQTDSTSLPASSSSTSLPESPSSTSLPETPSSTSLPGSSSDPSNDSVQDLVATLVQATGYLLQSSTNADLLASVNAVLDVSTSLGVDLGDLGLDDLVKQVDDIVDTALGVKTWCGDNGNATSPDTGNRGGSPTSASTPIIINAQDLLKSLGLDNLITIDGTIGGLGDLLTKPVNSLLQSLGLGGVKRWLGQ